MTFPRFGMIVYLVWGTLLAAAVFSLFYGRWSLAFVSLATLAASMLPAVVARWYHIHIPWAYFTGIVLFIFGSLFLGEAFDFYERYWWWDVVLHTASAIGFGLVGFVFVFYLFQGDRYAAPAWAMAFIAFCFAVTIGVLWEIFEFSMDQIFGLNMQKSGLMDTMWDLIVDNIGASIGAFAGFLYLKGQERGGLTSIIDEFVRRNRGFFKKFERRRK